MKLNRKWLLVIALVLSLAMTTAGTLAYLTDRDSAVNVFTVGNVEIDLVEDFTQGSQLIPGVDINKDVKIENTGKNDAWVWYTYAVPTALVDTGNDAGKNAIHFNLDGAYWDAYASEEQKATGETWHYKGIEHNVTTVESGVNYTVVTMLYNTTLAAGETTPVSLTNVYLDTRVDITPEGDMYWVEGGNATSLNWNIYTQGAPKIYVSAYAIQAEEFKTINEAYAAYNNQWGNNGTEYATPAVVVSTPEDLIDALEAGNDVIFDANIVAEAATTAPYGNKVAFIQNGGVLDGNGNTLTVECSGDDYGIMTSGGTIKNLTIDSGCRAIMIMSPTGDVVVDKVNIGGDGVLYAINTGEAGTDGVKLIVTNSTLAGWTSYGPTVESASFTNVKFEQGEYKDYASIYGRVLKPYVNTTLTSCSFIEHMNLDLSSLTEGHKVTFENCTVNGQVVTADVFTPYSGDDSVYDTALFSVDLPSWAESIDDCIAFN